MYRASFQSLQILFILLGWHYCKCNYTYDMNGSSLFDLANPRCMMQYISDTFANETNINVRLTFVIFSIFMPLLNICNEIFFSKIITKTSFFHMKKMNQKYGNQYSLLRQRFSRWVANKQEKRELFLLKVGPLLNDKRLLYTQH